MHGDRCTLIPMQSAWSLDISSYNYSIMISHSVELYRQHAAKIDSSPALIKDLSRYFFNASGKFAQESIVQVCSVARVPCIIIYDYMYSK